MKVRPCTAYVRKCTTVQYVTVAYRDNHQSAFFCEFATRPLWLYLQFKAKKHANDCWYFAIKKEKLARPKIIPKRERILGIDVNCVEKRELLVLWHEPLEMRCWENVGYCKQVYVAWATWNTLLRKRRLKRLSMHMLIVYVWEYGNYITNDGLLIISINWIGFICDHVWAYELDFIWLIIVVW